MKLTLDIVIAHLMGRKRQTIVSLMGIMLGVGFFIGISSMLRGSDADFIRRIIDNMNHITVQDEYREARVQPVEELYKDAAIAIHSLKPKNEIKGVAKFREILKFVQSQDGVRIAEVMSGPVIVNYKGTDYSLSLTGMHPDGIEAVTTIPRYMVEGTISALRSDSNGILVGKLFLDRSGLRKGDSIFVTASNGNSKLMKIVGVFETGTARTDRAMAYANIKKVQLLLDKPNRVNSLAIKMDDPYAARDFAAEIEGIFGYKSESWQEASEDIFNTLKIRNMLLYAVVSAILMVASIGIYNVISTIVMEKVKDIAIMKSMGFLPRDIGLIFMAEGLVLGLVGSLLGCAFGRGFIGVLASFRMKFPGVVKPQSFPLDYSLEPYLLAASIATAAAFLAAVMPSRKAGAVPPVDILRGAS